MQMRTLSLLRIQFTDTFWTHYQWLLGCRKALRVAKISCFLWTSKHQNLSIWFKIIFWTSSMYTGFQELKITYSSHLYICNNMVCLMGLQSHFRLPGSKEPLPPTTAIFQMYQDLHRLCLSHGHTNDSLLLPHWQWMLSLEQVFFL